MMRRQLDDVRSWGEPLAVLTASEPVIYGRFGYGAATRQLRAEIDTSRVRLSVPEGTDDVRLRLVEPDEPAVRDACEAVYARRVSAPGPECWSGGPAGSGCRCSTRRATARAPRRCSACSRSGTAKSWAMRATSTSRSGTRPAPRAAIELRDLEALDPAAYAALWQHLFGIDLTSTVKTHSRPMDDAWQHLVSDIRRCGVGSRDSLYVRLVDVGAALEARTYQAPVDVVFEVEDTFCPWNEGRWRLTGDAKGASCVRTADAADLDLSVRELGSAYLGGVSLASLAAAGRVRELRQGALAEASLGFSSVVEPWLPHGF